MHMAWLKLAKEIVDSVNRNSHVKSTCPKCKNHSIDYQYVGNLVTRIGYLNIWCKECHTGIHISRIKIPDNANVISFDTSEEELAKRIPNFMHVAR
ncbi:hypothetical protein SRRS_05210 [Sporomusa rhizae]|uniref:hypothetical protein n=1 Tax=Sporomusa rhizae TaxID=357999 RepID=UPI00352AD26D